LKQLTKPYRNLAAVHYCCFVLGFFFGRAHYLVLLTVPYFGLRRHALTRLFGDWCEKVAGEGLKEPLHQAGGASNQGESR
jgi:hypothetical protein